MASNIRATLELGNHYAANRQWHNASATFKRAFAELCSGVAPGEPLEPVAELEQALRALGDEAVAVDQAPAAIARLRELQLQAHPDLGLERARFISAFRVAPVDHWTIVHHDQREVRAGDVTIVLPMAPVALALEIRRDGLRSAPISAARAAQLSYALSHLAWADVTIAIQLYTVSKVLDRVGIPALQKEACRYHMALLLRPDSPWALSHLGETYRNIANGWPPGVVEMTTPDGRVRDYITALLYFEAAIRLNPRDFWAHAHLGAAIVNARAFTGATDGIATFQGLLERWFPDVAPDRRDEALLDKAWASLDEAQHLRGDFYPWAQLYAADVLIIQSVVFKDRAKAAEAGRLGMVMTLDAMYLQPQMAGDLFEPAELYDNAFYQVSLLSLWNGDFLLAWQYACFGMSRAFKFQFIPGLQCLLGYQLLVNIAAQNVCSPKGSGRPEVEAATSLLGRYRLGDTSLFPYPVPPLIDSKAGLIELIRGVFEHVAVPTVSTFLEREIALDTSISISLTQVIFILLNFQQVLRESSDDTAHGVLRGAMDDFIQAILGKLSTSSSCAEDCVLALKGHEDGYHHGTDDMCAQFHLGTLSHKMAGMLHLVAKPPA